MGFLRSRLAGVVCRRGGWLIGFVLAQGCSEGQEPRGGEPPPGTDGSAEPRELRINEVVSDNGGVWVDELGETDDYVELINLANRPLELSDYQLTDRSKVVTLPPARLEPGAVLLLWADGTPAQGERHLPFQVSAEGEVLSLVRRDGLVVDRVRVPRLEEHHAYSRLPDGEGAFVDCGYATPGRLNGKTCGPPARPELPEQVRFAPFFWPPDFPPLPYPLVITELMLLPPFFVEVYNRSDQTLDLDRYELRVAPHSVGVPWPDVSTGAVLAWPVSTLGAGERVAVAVTASDVEAVVANGAFEGVVTLWQKESAEAVDRVDFMHWPEGKSLARSPDPDGRLRYCEEATPGQPNQPCTEVASRPVGDRLRHLRTPGDFHALSTGQAELGTASVEFLIDLAGGKSVFLRNSAAWDLHYTFVREAIEGLPHLDRCDPDQYADYLRGWYEFSVAQYFETSGSRRYLLGTLVEHAGSNLHTVEFAPGDQISADQMVEAFFVVTEHVLSPQKWAIRPQTSDQVERLRAVEGRVPIVDPNAPFRGLTYQPLVTGVAFGSLRFVPAEEIGAAGLGPRDILLTDQIPNDLPLVAGLITEAFQTPLSHVNVLSRSRGTPNMALRDARQDSRVGPLVGQLVRLEVMGSDFALTAADPAEALAYWESRQPTGPPPLPRIDRELRGIQRLSEHSLASLPALGGKAAGLAELGRVRPGAVEPPLSDQCLALLGTDSLEIPARAIALPIGHSLEHYRKSGALSLLEELRRDARFVADPSVRARGLEQVRGLIRTYPVDPELLEAVESYWRETWPGQRLRLRSSSNTEDLAQFNGAGLYQSVGIEAEEPPEVLADAIRSVWASLWNLRAYDEREYHRIDHREVGMAVLIHPAFPGERANGVAVSRNLLDPASAAHAYYFNAQVGEALVTNPAPGVTSDEFTYDLERKPHLRLYGESSLTGGSRVLSETEAQRIACSLCAIHRHFRPLLDPDQTNRWFAMDIEWKLVGEERSLVVKQARPYIFGAEPPSGWCDF